MKTIKITTDNKISIIDINLNDFREIQGAIGGHFEMVRADRIFEFFGCPVVMIVDEEGLIKDLPINYAGSYMYGVDRHGTLIVGDIIFAQQVWEDFCGLEDVEATKKRLMERFGFLEDEDDK